VAVEKLPSFSPPEQRATAFDVTRRVRQMHELTLYVSYTTRVWKIRRVEPAKRAEWREDDGVGGTTETVQFFVIIYETYI
jgi:hypothetical protein